MITHLIQAPVFDAVFPDELPDIGSTAELRGLSLGRLGNLFTFCVIADGKCTGVALNDEQLVAMADILGKLAENKADAADPWAGTTCQ